NERMKKSFLEIMSNRKMIKIPYDDIVFIESLSDYVKVNTINGQFMSKEKISSVYEKLPSVFLRIHRSFIINKDKLKRISYNEVLVGEVKLNIGRSYRKDVKQNLNKK
ncbi:MAG: LytTR family DNA-binding domain-containing protein, partial [Perlabentimonas sp.]